MDSYGSFNQFPEPPESVRRLWGDRRNLRSIGTAVGCCLIAYIALQYALFFLVSLFGLNELYGDSELFRNSFSGICSVISLGVPFCIMALARRNKSEPLEFSLPVKKLSGLLLISIGFLVCLAASYGIGIFEQFVSEFGVNFPEIPDSMSNVSSPAAVALLLINTAIAPALIEEFAFRGVIMQPLRRYGDGFAIVTSAFVFAVCHSGSMQMLFAFIVGLVLGYAAVSSGSLWVSIAIHFLNNAFVTVISIVSAFAPDSLGTFYSLSFAAAVILGLAATVIYFMIFRQKLSRGVTLLREREKLSRFLLSPTMLLALAAFAAIAVLDWLTRG